MVQYYYNIPDGGICIRRGSRDKIRDSGLTHDRWNGEILRKF